MPLYEYECEAGHRFEEYHRMDDRHDASCPECDGPVRLRISLSSFRLAVPFTVCTHDGKILHRQPDGGTKLPSVEDEAKELKKEYA